MTQDYMQPCYFFGVEVRPEGQDRIQYLSVCVADDRPLISFLIARRLLALHGLNVANVHWAGLVDKRSERSQINGLRSKATTRGFEWIQGDLSDELARMGCLHALSPEVSQLIAVA